MQDVVSMRNRIEPHLASLRLYARALAGTQTGGDDLVREALEAFLEAPGVLSVDADPKQHLFCLFHACHDSQRGVFPADDCAALPHPARHALLLTALAGFNTEQASRILGESEAQVERAIAKARAAISEMIRSRVLIIEDEPLIALHLEQLMMDMGHEVVALARTGVQALEAVQDHAPDLILVDIHLGDGPCGITVVNAVLADADIPVVFVTAYPERLLTGDGPEPVFVVTKPFDPDALIATVGQALLSRLATFAPAD